MTYALAKTSSFTRWPRLPVLPLAVALAAAGCAQAGIGLEGGAATGAGIETSSLAPVTSPAESSVTTAAIEQARKLRLAGDKQQASRVLEAAARKEPADKALMKERGLLALEAGQVRQSETLLRKAFDPAAPDWRLHSALGSSLAAQHKQPEAQLQFAKALEMVPDHPSVLNNLALSYALEGRHEEAERLLRRVAQREGAEPKAKQNLALILGLKGKGGEAQKIAETVLAPETARANVSYLASLRHGGERAAVSHGEGRAESALAAATGPN